MSHQEAARFYDDLKTNNKLRNAVQSVQETMCALAKSHGYDFSHDELMEHLGEVWGADFESDTDNVDDPQTCTCV